MPLEYLQPPEDWMQVVSGLLGLRQQGILFAVWIDEWVIHVQWGEWSLYRERLPWVRARLMIEANRKGPGSQSVIITEEKTG